jgi:hypothetical protein
VAGFFGERGRVANLSRIPRTARSLGAQRLNVGLTLLALVFLTVMAAAASVRASRPHTTVNPRTETLAVLGVAPSSGTSSTVSEARDAPAQVRRKPS